MKKHLITTISVICAIAIVIVLIFATSDNGAKSDTVANGNKGLTSSASQVINDAKNSDQIKTAEDEETAYIDSEKDGEVTKSANPAVGIEFDSDESYYDIEKTDVNFKVSAKDGDGSVVYVKYDAASELVLGDFPNGFATVMKTNEGSLVHVYDLANLCVYKVVTPSNTRAIKQLESNKFAIQCGTKKKGFQTYTFSTSPEYAFDLYISNDNIIMLVDGSNDYDVESDVKSQKEGATTQSIENNDTEEAVSETVADTEETVIEETNSETTEEKAADTKEKSDSKEEVTKETVTNVEESTSIKEETEETKEESTEEETTEAETRNETLAKLTGKEVSKKGGKVFIDAPVIAQMPEYPTGCESVSTVMDLQYWGIDISVDEFIDNYLDKSSDFYWKDDNIYGPDVQKCFVGNPYDDSGYGCGAGAIEIAVNKIVDKDTVNVLNLKNVPVSALCSAYIDNGIPVILWANILMCDATEANSWKLEDGTDYTWLSNEHCMLLVGYDDDCYYFNDPYTGSVEAYSKEDVERCYDQQGCQAIVICNK